MHYSMKVAQSYVINSQLTKEIVMVSTPANMNLSHRIVCTNLHSSNLAITATEYCGNHALRQ